MKIEVTRAFCIAGERQEVGSVLDVEPKFAAELIHNQKAVKATEQAEKPVAKKTAAKEKTE
jgi:hypothetical protein